MLRSQELPDCFYRNKATLIRPNAPTPNHSLYLSNLDDQKFLRFSIKYLYLFRKAVALDILKCSLSKVLVDYYPLAGRLRTCSQDDHKLQIDCNAEGAVFVDAFMDITCDEFLQLSRKPNRSWRKLIYRVEVHSFLEIPPIVVQVTNLPCGGMILCTAINHCTCDGIGTSQFLHAWAHAITKPKSAITVLPFNSRHVLKPRNPPQITHTHLGYTKTTLKENFTHVDIKQYLQSQPLVPTSFTFTPVHVLRLKRQCVPSLKCTAFETLASHTWRSWVRSLDLSPPTSKVKLLFSVNVRKKLIPELPEGYYGNGFVLGCAETGVKELVTANLHHGINLIQQAKSCLSDGYVRSLIDLLEDKNVKTDTCSSFVISQWAKLGLEDLDFGEGKPLHMGPLTSDIYCLFLPVVGNFEAVRVQVSVPECVVEKFEYYMMHGLDNEDNGDIIGFHNGEQTGCI
ncbi:hypothetical protein F3Y22_tig00110236pilonHSYRG00123 [Hibiscus syriacus]|uniref:Omega-hydroxypalmitate O-feruloyl transferase n=1 Tax=Hibiscus syriacus TaxID=106335 RepID=A0A6A3B8P3_HIBSY|nr:alcohol acyltransferase 9-like [Hibiscus syriacus]KAE8712703.1 hypothetical protein F3Y22_tig00110236pilonHSYRG00123 [Hibiscus syriacus]